MAWLVFSGSGAPATDHRISGAQVTIGRGDCDVRLRHNRVSKHHCRIVVRGRRFAIVNQSGQGTKVNGQLIPHDQEYPFGPDDVATLGPIEMRLQLQIQEELRTTGQHGVPLLLGRSHAMRKVNREIAVAAPTTDSVLILGETGTGKSHAAKVIHGMSSTGPFEAVNCATLDGADGTLVEAKLFGYERGAFTGAHERTDGLFQRANGGTLFLDEVGDLPPAQQGKLLTALETGRVRRLNGAEERVNVRVISATHRTLQDHATFRHDLYFRLSTFKVHLPPLRTRRSDIPELARWFLEQDHPDVAIPDATLEALARQPWPGNVRELRQALTRLAAEARAHGTPQIPNRTHATKEEILKALADAPSERQAFSRLHMTRSTFKRLMKRYGIPSRPKKEEV